MGWITSPITGVQHSSWDSYFKDIMSVFDLYHYGTQLQSSPKSTDALA
jgi:hypothetical protein